MSSIYELEADTYNAPSENTNPFIEDEDDENSDIEAILSIKSGSRSLDYNSKEYTLEDDISSKVYIFRNGLFIRTLLPINLSKDREIRINCTR